MFLLSTRFLGAAVVAALLTCLSACAGSNQTAPPEGSSGAAPRGIVTAEALRARGDISAGAPEWVSDPARASAMDSETHLYGVGCAELMEGSLADASKSQAFHRAMDEMTSRSATDMTVTDTGGTHSSEASRHARFGPASIEESWTDAANRVLWLLVRAERVR